MRTTEQTGPGAGDAVLAEGPSSFTGCVKLFKFKNLMNIVFLINIINFFQIIQRSNFYFRMPRVSSYTNYLSMSENWSSLKFMHSGDMYDLRTNQVKSIKNMRSKSLKLELNHPMIVKVENLHTVWKHNLKTDFVRMPDVCTTYSVSAQRECFRFFWSWICIDPHSKVSRVELVSRTISSPQT